MFDKEPTLDDASMVADITMATFFRHLALSACGRHAKLEIIASTRIPGYSIRLRACALLSGKHLVGQR